MKLPRIAVHAFVFAHRYVREKACRWLGHKEVSWMNAAICTRCHRITQLSGVRVDDIPAVWEAPVSIQHAEQPDPEDES